MNVIKPNPGYGPWGPFIGSEFEILQVTRVDIAIASAAFCLACIFAISAAYIAISQSRRSSKPWRCTYLWMVWLEWGASVVIAVECLLYLLRYIRPSFYFFMSIRKYITKFSKGVKLTMCSGVLDHSNPAFTANHHQSNPTHST